VNRTRTAAILGAAAIAGATIAGCASKGNYDGPAPAPTTAHSAAPVAATTPAPDKCTQLATWNSSGGKAQIGAVTSDLGEVQLAAQSENLGTVEAAGTMLESDARTAAANPPPIARNTYVRAMTYLETAGATAASGDIAGATAMLQLGTSQIVAATQDIKAQCN